jgi:hypothetical protein
VRAAPRDVASAGRGHGAEFVARQVCARAGLATLPTVAITSLLHASCWEWLDVCAFVARQVCARAGCRPGHAAHGSHYVADARLLLGVARRVRVRPLTGVCSRRPGHAAHGRHSVAAARLLLGAYIGFGTHNNPSMHRLRARKLLGWDPGPLSPPNSERPHFFIRSCFFILKFW